MGQLILIKASTESHMVLDTIIFINTSRLRGTVWNILVDSSGGQPWRHPVKHPLIFTLLYFSEQETMFNSLFHDDVCERNLLCVLFLCKSISHTDWEMGCAHFAHFPDVCSFSVVLNMHIFLSFPNIHRHTYTEKHTYVNA